MLKKLNFFFVLLIIGSTQVFAQDPSVAAPDPVKAQEDVLSVYSDAYTSICEILFPDWGQPTAASEIQVDGNNTLKYADLSYMGLQYTKSDIVYLEYVHLDYYTTDATALKFTIVVTGNEKAYDIGSQLGITRNQWVSVDIPLSYFSTLDLTRAFQFKTEGNGTVYLDNLYFWKDPTTQANDATLSNITVDGVSVDNFSSRTFSYLADLICETTTIPTIDATSSSPTATFEITQATTIPGSAYIVVLSEDETKTRTYTVNIQATTPPVAAPAPTNNSEDVVSIYSDAFPSVATNLYPDWSQNTIASEIQIDGDNTLKYYSLNFMGIEYEETDLSAYEYLHLDYFMTTATTWLSASLITKEGETLYNISVKLGLEFNKWVSIDIPLSFYDATRDMTSAYQLKIQGNKTVYLDNVYFWKEPTVAGTDVSLSDLTVDGSTIDGFNTARESYILDFPYGTTTVPSIGVVTTDPQATYVITPAESMPGTTTIVVTSYDETVTATYTVEFTTTIPPVPAPTPTKDEDFVISVYSDAYTSIATNVNPDWGQETLVSEFQIDGNSTLKYARLNYQGMDFPNPTDVSEMEYLHVDFFTGDATKLELYLIASGENSYNIASKKGISYNEWNRVDIPMFVYANAGRDLEAAYQFKITGDGTIYFDNFYFFKANPANDATLSDLKVNGSTIKGFYSGTLDYTYGVSEGTTTVPEVTVSTTYSLATYEITPASTIPGTTVIVVTAEDGVTSKTYSVDFEVSTGITEMKNSNSFSVYPNPASDFLKLDAEGIIESVEILDLSGRCILHVNACTSDGSVNISTLNSGLYIIRAKVNGSLLSSKLVIK